MVAQADFNQDRFTDLVTLDSTAQARLNIYLWNVTLEAFVKRGLPTTVNSTIVSVLPGDFDYDGQTDLMVVYDMGVTYSLEFRLLTGCDEQCTMSILEP